MVGYATGYATASATPYAPGSSPAGGAPAVVVASAGPFVADLVGFLAAGVPAIRRFYPGRLPRAGVVYPAAVHNLVYADRWTHLGGASAAATEHYQIDVYGNDHATASSAFSDLRRALLGAAGAYPRRMGGTLVRECSLGDRTTTFEPFPAAGDQGGLHRLMGEFCFVFDEPLG